MKLHASGEDYLETILVLQIDFKCCKVFAAWSKR